MNTMNGLYSFFTGVTGKHGRGYFTPDEIGVFYTAAQKDLYHECMGDLPLRQAEEALRPFINATPPSTVASVLIPPDYHRRIGLYYNPGNNIIQPVVVCDEERAASAATNSLRGGSGNRYALMRSGSYDLMPATPLPGLTLRYYGKPDDIIFGWREIDGEIDINDTNVARASTPGSFLRTPASKLPVFEESYWLTLSHRALRYAGINISDDALTAAAQKFAEEDEKNMR